MKELISPCCKCRRKHRRQCWKTCEQLKDYVKALGDPWIGIKKFDCSFELPISDGCRQIFPLPGAE